MPDRALRLRRRIRTINRSLREFRLLAKGALSTRHPVMAHIIPIRRCNLSCAYCNEYDDYSKPVALEVMQRRIDQLADLGTTIITLSGGEPLLHPELDSIIRRMRQRGVLACMITNGYLLTPERVKRLNQAGLDHMQISIDNVMPDDVSKKSLKVLDKKLQILAAHADFHVNINSVVGGGIRNPEDALVVGQRAIELGFSSSIGIIHDSDGQLRPLSDRERTIYRPMKSMEKRHSRGSAFSRMPSPMAAPAIGVAVPEPGIFMSAKMAWCITARNNAATQPSPWQTTQWKIFAANTSPQSPALRSARSPVFTTSPTSISSALRKRFRARVKASNPNGWSKSNPAINSPAVSRIGTSSPGGRSFCGAFAITIPSRGSTPNIGATNTIPR